MIVFEDYDGKEVRLFAFEKWFEGLLRLEGDIDEGLLEFCGIKRYLQRWCNLYTRYGIIRFEFEEIKEIQLFVDNVRSS